MTRPQEPNIRPLVFGNKVHIKIVRRYEQQLEEWLWVQCPADTIGDCDDGCKTCGGKGLVLRAHVD